MGKWWAVGDLDCPASAYQDKAQVIVIRSVQEEASPGEQYAVPHQNPLATPDPKALPRVQAFPGAIQRIRHRYTFMIPARLSVQRSGRSEAGGTKPP